MDLQGQHMDLQGQHMDSAGSARGPRGSWTSRSSCVEPYLHVLQAVLPANQRAPPVAQGLPVSVVDEDGDLPRRPLGHGEKGPGSQNHNLPTKNHIHGDQFPISIPQGSTLIFAYFHIE